MGSARAPPVSQEESAFSPKPPAEGSTRRNQCGGHCQDSDTKGRYARAAARCAHLPSGVSGCQFCLTWWGTGASINSQLLLPAVEARDGKEDVYAPSSEASKVRTSALGAQVKMVTDAAASARMNFK